MREAREVQSGSQIEERGARLQLNKIRQNGRGV
jgi:hypothetical protein